MGTLHQTFHTDSSLQVSRAPHVAVVGAGIIGICCALSLQRAGFAVTVYDPLPPGSGASYGNAGLISVQTCIPMALPGILNKVPRWLLDPDGPLSVRPSYLPKALPWLLQWWLASRKSQVLHSSDALLALHQGAFDEYRTLLGLTLFTDLIKISGQIHVSERVTDTAEDRMINLLRERQGVDVQALNSGELQDLVPQISHKIQHGILFPRHGFTVNPMRLVQTLANLFVQAGGQIIHEQVLKISPHVSAPFRVLTNLADHPCDKVLLTAGAWSKKLLKDMRVHVPLETERGYHLMLRQPSLDLRLPVLHKDKAFVATPLETGLRLAGTVEIAGLEPSPDERRAQTLLRHAQDLFPGLQGSEQSVWMGHRPSTPDSLPVIDELAAFPGMFLALGHGHFGMTAAGTTAKLITQLMTQAPSSLNLHPYRVSRF